MRLLITLFSTAVTFAAGSTILAQTAALTGRVTDSTGSVVPRAKVTATSTASRVETSVDTNEQGFYNITSLQPGGYDVSVTKSGFQTLRHTGLELTVQQ